jgi:hypothetical protein
MRRAALPALALALAGVAGAAAANVRVEPTSEPLWYDGLSLRLEWNELRFLLWPQEGVAIERFERVARHQVHGPTADATGGLRYRIAGLATPGVTLDVEVVAEPDALELRYTAHNDSDRAHAISIAPCLQLAKDFTGPPGWSRAKRVFLPSVEHGWRWIADTEQRRGERARAEDPDPASAPWSQHFAAPGQDAARNPGLRLFGVAHEHAAAGFIGAASGDGAAMVAVATERALGVTYALLDCLHVTPALDVPAHASARARVRVYFHRGDFAALLARVRAEQPGVALPQPDAGFLAPDARAIALEAEASGTQAWRVATPEIAAGAILGVSIAPRAQADESSDVALVVTDPTGWSARIGARLGRRTQRLLVPLPGPRGAATLSLALHTLRGGGVALEAVALHLPRW